MSEGVRESRSRGDIEYSTQEVTGTKGNQWFVIWERGGKDTHVGIQIGPNIPIDLEDAQ